MKFLGPVLSLNFIFLFFPLSFFVPQEEYELDLHDNHVNTFEGVKGKNGYAIFYPGNKSLHSEEVIIFLHGYGGYNPMVYGAWIDHLVRNGKTVIFPYYQDNMIRPAPEAFAGCASGAIKNALSIMRDSLKMDLPSQLHYIGHSFGGVIASHLAARSDSFGLIDPGAILLCMAGTGPFQDGILSNYEAIPSDCVLGVIVGEDDHVVGDEFSRLVYTTSISVDRKFWMLLDKRSGNPKLTGGHNEACARLAAFDNGIRNYNYARTILTGRVDAHDSLACWRTFDWLMDNSKTPESKWLHHSDRAYLSDLGKDSKGRPYGDLLIHKGIILPQE
ncbi:MAG: hypothetical protein KA479_02760 [Saprospiraceae bacterium]|nr:hypothetical protein [Saprospiraceae bacterium]